jgi:hypothetical protein
MIFAFARTGLEVFVINKIRNYFLIKELASYLAGYRKNLPEKLKSRIKSYSRIASLPNLWFSELRGYSLGRDETLANRYLGASTPIFDDLLDYEGYSYNELLEIIRNDNDIDNESLLLLKYLYDNILSRLKDPALFHHYLAKTAEAQMMSIRQKDNSSLTTDEIRDITFKKGGHSTLLYRSLLSNKLLAGEEEAVYHLGGLLQLMNDIFDIYDDYNNEQQTLATTANDINPLNKEYRILIGKTLDLFRNLEYHKERIEKALDSITTVISRGCVCLDRLLALQGNNNVFNIKEYSRRDLVCDMEKIPNIRRNLSASNEIIKG